jgi:hypothetical protein
MSRVACKLSNEVIFTIDIFDMKTQLILSNIWELVKPGRPKKELALYQIGQKLLR